MVRKAGSGRVWEVWPPFAGSELLVLYVLILKTKNGTRGRKLEENWKICFCLVEFITEGLFCDFVMRWLQIFTSNILLTKHAKCSQYGSKFHHIVGVWKTIHPKALMPPPSPPSSTGFVLPWVERVRLLPNTHFGIFQPHERK